MKIEFLALLLALTAPALAGCTTPEQQLEPSDEEPHPFLRASLSSCTRINILGAIPGSQGNAEPGNWTRSETVSQYILSAFECQRIGIGAHESPGSLVLEAIGEEGIPRSCYEAASDAIMIRRIQHAWTSTPELARTLEPLLATNVSPLRQMSIEFPELKPGMLKLEFTGEHGLEANFEMNINTEYDELDTHITTYFGDGQEGLAAVHVKEYEDRSDLNQGIAYGTWPERPLSPGNAAPHPGTISLSYGSYEIRNENLEGTECADA